MTVFERLAGAIRRQSSEGELPDFIVPVLMAVAQHPAGYAGREALVEKLLQQVEEYETFSNVCCEKIGYCLEDIQRTLAQLRQS